MPRCATFLRAKARPKLVDRERPLCSRLPKCAAMPPSQRSKRPQARLNAPRFLRNAEANVGTIVNDTKYIDRKDC